MSQQETLQTRPPDIEFDGPISFSDVYPTLEGTAAYVAPLELQPVAATPLDQPPAFLNDPFIVKYFASEADRIDFLRTLTPEMYEVFLASINASITGKYNHGRFPDEETEGGFRGITESDSSCQLSTKLLSPAKAERHRLSAESLAVAQRLPDIRQSAALLGLIQVSSQNFSDANERTATAVYTLFTRGYDGSRAMRTDYEQLFQPHENQLDVHNPHWRRLCLAGRFSIRQTIQILAAADYDGPLPTTAAPLPNHLKDDNGQPLIASGKITRSNQYYLELLSKERHFNLPLFTRFMVDTGRDMNAAVELRPHSPPTMLAIGEIASELTDADVATLARLHSELKYAFGRGIIDSFNPTALPEWDACASDITAAFDSYVNNGRLPRRFWL